MEPTKFPKQQNDIGTMKTVDDLQVPITFRKAC